MNPLPPPPDSDEVLPPPPADDAGALPSPPTIPAGGVAQITVARPSAFPDMLRAYRILVDGREVGKVGNNSRVTFTVPAGAHTMVARIDFAGSQPLSFEAQAGENLVIECVSALRGWRTLLALYYVLFKRDHYLQVRRVS